jgi:AraC-like DNA-binding protein
VDARVNAAIQRMENGLQERLTVPQLARDVELSVAQLTRLFRRDTGATPGTYLHSLRLARAKTLLERTSLSVGEVMRQVGLSDRGHFARDFLRRYGSSPRSFRLASRPASRGDRLTCDEICRMVRGVHIARPAALVLRRREATAMNHAKPTVNVTCPECGAQPCVLIVRSLSGVYCECRACSHRWHVEGLAVQRRPGRPTRRKTDVRGNP